MNAYILYSKHIAIKWLFIAFKLGIAIKSILLTEPEKMRIIPQTFAGRKSRT